MFKLSRLCAAVLLVGLVGVAWGAVNKISTFTVEESWGNCAGTCEDTGGPCTAVFGCSGDAACIGIGDPVPLNMDPNADGMAILKHVSGADKTMVQIIVSDFTGAPVDRFIVRLDPHVGDLGTFLVGSQGNGHFHGEIAGDHQDSNVELWQQVQPPPCPPVLIASGG